MLRINAVCFACRLRKVIRYRGFYDSLELFGIEEANEIDKLSDYVPDLNACASLVLPVGSRWLQVLDCSPTNRERELG